MPVILPDRDIQRPIADDVSRTRGGRKSQRRGSIGHARRPDTLRGQVQVSASGGGRRTPGRPAAGAENLPDGGVEIRAQGGRRASHSAPGHQATHSTIVPAGGGLRPALGRHRPAVSAIMKAYQQNKDGTEAEQDHVQPRWSEDRCDSDHGTGPVVTLSVRPRIPGSRADASAGRREREIAGHRRDRRDPARRGSAVLARFSSVLQD